MATAAIHNGADAIYVGMPGFNARGRSHDHSFEQLQEIIELAHLYNVQVHVAFNILIFENEINDAITAITKVLALGPDALIIQDLGLVKIIRQITPNQVIHASTQMTTTNHEAIELLDDLNIQRFVLGRENSLEEIKIIKEKTNKELEVFVHGALCVAYSGQCFTSESLGGRSANRGQCAQSCRFEYELYVDDKKKELLDKKFLVSPKDLCGIDDIPALKKLGVESFKVEGRLKSPEFVASVARSYRDAIDNDTSSEKSKLEMAMTFSRGFYNGWLGGVAHQELVDGSYGSNRGVEVGIVLKVHKDGLLISSHIEIQLGDGLFIAGIKTSLGASVYNVTKKADGYLVKFDNKISLKEVEFDARVFVNSRDSLSKELKKTYTDKTQFKKLFLDIEVNARLDHKIEVKASIDNIEVNIQSDFICEKASNSSVTSDSILSALSGLSHTPYQVRSHNISVDEELFIPGKVLKLLKQSMVAELNAKRLHREQPINTIVIENIPVISDQMIEPILNILLRTLEQCESFAVEFSGSKNIGVVTLDYEFGKDYVKSVKLLKEHGFNVAIATTRILKPNEYHNFRLIERAAPDGILVRNLGALNYFQDSAFDLYGDFSLNVSNSHTFNYLHSKKLKSICLSYDLNATQLGSLIKNIDGSVVEITVHQYMPEFHMEHCVFAAFLSKGNSFRDCGKPCEKHKVHLKDMFGNTHEIKADQECRNTMYNASPMSAASLVPGWIESGVKNFRLEALHETSDELNIKVHSYIDLISNKLDPQSVLDKMGEVGSYGVTTGQLFNKKQYEDRKKNV
jgi:putative protease